MHRRQVGFPDLPPVLKKAAPILTAAMDQFGYIHIKSSLVPVSQRSEAV